MCDWGTDRDVRLAFPNAVSGRTTVAVDACIADLIQRLNDNGVHTIGCCCGHHRGHGSILIEQEGETIELILPQPAGAAAAPPDPPGESAVGEGSSTSQQLLQLLIDIRDHGLQMGQFHHLHRKIQDAIDTLSAVGSPSPQESYIKFLETDIEARKTERVELLQEIESLHARVREEPSRPQESCACDLEHGPGQSGSQVD